MPIYLQVKLTEGDKKELLKLNEPFQPPKELALELRP
jgi:hypothetical protein